MRDEKTIHQRLQQLRGQLLQWGTPELRVFVITKDELRGWIAALEWVLQSPSRQVGLGRFGSVRGKRNCTTVDRSRIGIV
jgi:hypothetical protein